MMITTIQHNRRETDGFRLVQPHGSRGYTVYFFRSQVDLELQGATLSVAQGSCMIYPPEMPQQLAARGTLIYSRLEASEDITTQLLQYRLPLGQPFHLPDIEAVSDVFKRAEQEFYMQNPYREDMLDACVQMLLILLTRALDEAPAAALPQDMHLDIRNIRQHVLSNPQRKWTVADMAQMMSLSPSRFHAIYKEVFGSAPMRDVIEAKIEYAKNLLLDRKNFSLPQIADMLGYNDQYHFIRQFRTETGITPGAYRKSHR